MGVTNEKPNPSAGQVWELDSHLRTRDWAGQRVEGFRVEWAGILEWDHINDVLRCWSCVGIETPAGRVMVGDRRTGGIYQAGTVLRVQGDGDVRLRGDNGVEWSSRAVTVAGWELLGPLASAAPKAIREDRCNCGASKPTFCAMCAGCSGEALMPEQYDRVTFGGGVEVPSMTWQMRDTNGRSIGKTRGTWTHEWDFVDTQPAPYATMADVQRLLSSGYKVRPEALARLGLASSDPRAESERQRREIDAVLRDDARRFPEFATARKCAVVAMFEDAPPVPPEEFADDILVEQWLVNLRDYEDLRGAGREPTERSKRLARCTMHDQMVAVYERTRCL